MSETDRIVNSSESPTKSNVFLSHITAICRVWTFIVLIVMWAAAITTVHDGSENVGYTVYIGWYLIAASILVTFIEVTWLIDKAACCTREGCCCRCWSVVMWLDTWKRGILYILLSVPLYMDGLRSVLGVVSGFLLVIAGCLYLVKTFKRGTVVTVTETRYIKIVSPQVKVVSTEMATQTEDDHYYSEMVPKNPFDE